MKKIGVIGKDGFIGEVLFNFLSELNSYEVTGTTIDTLNITDSREIENFVKSEKCDVIILLAGSKNVKELEANPDFGYKINVKPVEDFINNITNERFLYMSSDYVFDGAEGKYTNSDKVCPNTVYGRNKAEAEKIIQNSGKNYGIIRTAGVLGEKSVFLSWFINVLNTEKQVKMFENSYFTPTCVKFLCQAIEKIVNDKSNRIYHAVQEKRLSRYELACTVKKILNSDCEIIPEETEFADRSLVQCDFIKSIRTKSFEECLKGELCIK